MQRHKIRLDLVLAGVVLLLLFSLLPFFFQRQVYELDEPSPLASSFDSSSTISERQAQAKDQLFEEAEFKVHQKRPIAHEKPKKMDNIIVDQPSEFDETLKKYFEEHDGTVLVYLYGNIQPHTGKSWCPDCAAADGPIRAAAAEAGVTLIEAPVGERHEYKGVPSNPYRVHPQVKLVAVPTIIKWTKDGPGARLVENECRSKSAVVAFLA